MDKKKVAEIDALLQKLLDRENDAAAAEKEPPPRRTLTGSGNVIRRRKGQPDKRIALSGCV